MDFVFVFSLFWILYGIAGVFGLQFIHAKYRGHDWTKSYVQKQGVSWLLLGVPWLIFDMALGYFSADIGCNLLCQILIVLAIPSIIFTFAIDRKYGSKLKNTKSE